MAFWQMFYSVGSFIAYWVNYGCQEHAERLGNWDWRMVVIFQLLVPTLIIVQLWFIPETPRWYIQHGDKVDNARASLRRVRDTDESVEDEILAIREAIEFEREAISSGYSALWRDRSVRKRLLLALVLNAGQQITGQGSLNSYSTLVYQKVFGKGSSQIALINALNATFGILFTLNAAWTVDRFGRKFLLIVGALGMSACMIIVASVETQTPSGVDGTKTHAVGVAIVFLMFLFAFFCEPSPLFSQKHLTNTLCRQTLLGRDSLDLDKRGLQHECTRTSRRHGVADAKRGQRHRAAILPHVPRQLRLLRLLHVCRDQRAAGHLYVVLHSRDQEDRSRGD